MPPPNPGSHLAQALAALSADEMIAALGPLADRRLARKLLAPVLRRMSHPLGEMLARFDAATRERGISRAAKELLDRKRATLAVTGRAATSGAALFVANHPGAYDAIAVLAAIGRDDVTILANRRTFLQALPAMQPTLVYVPEAPGEIGGRAAGLRAALGALDRGGALLHFGAGRIEPDLAFDAPDDRVAFHPGTGLLARATWRRGGIVVPVTVLGVHSRRAKRLRVVRRLEARGVTTLAPLLSVAVRLFADVRIRVVLGPPVEEGSGDDVDLAARIRTAVYAGRDR